MNQVNLSSPKQLKSLLDQHDFSFRKSLGQNFLIDQNILLQIVDQANLSEQDHVVEIGPGAGTLTQQLAKRCQQVTCIEIDRKLKPILEDTLASYENVDIIFDDILAIDLEKIWKKQDQRPIKVIANLPYYITTAVIMRFLESKIPVERFVVMVQKEVAQRMAAIPSTKAYGSLSIAVQYFCIPKLVMKVSKHAFMPQPKVGSAVLLLKKRDEKHQPQDLDLFFRVVKAGFSKRRKTIKNSLQGAGIFDKAITSMALTEAKIDPTRRAESLTIEEFIGLADAFYHLNG